MIKLGLIQEHLQLRAKETAPLVNKNYNNEIALREQNLPLNYREPLEMLINL